MPRIFLAFFAFLMVYSCFASQRTQVEISNDFNIKSSGGCGIKGIRITNYIVIATSHKSEMHRT